MKPSAKISDIEVSNVPQFGNCESVKSIPEILSTVGTCGMNYTQLGYKLKQDVNSTAEANMKYGENHGKAACVLGIARVEGGRFYSTVMGEGFQRVGKEDRDHLLTYLYFKIPIVQNLICKAQKGVVNGYDLMPEMKISTQKRRGQCLRSILKKMYELSEQRLKEVAKSGNENNLKKVMDYEHHDIEYAFLFTLTPEYTKNTIVKKRGLTFEN